MADEDVIMKRFFSLFLFLFSLPAFSQTGPISGANPGDQVTDVDGVCRELVDLTYQSTSGAHDKETGFYYAYEELYYYGIKAGHKKGYEKWDSILCPADDEPLQNNCSVLEGQDVTFTLNNFFRPDFYYTGEFQTSNSSSGTLPFGKVGYIFPQISPDDPLLQCGLKLYNVNEYNTLPNNKILEAEFTYRFTGNVGLDGAPNSVVYDALTADDLDPDGDGFVGNDDSCPDEPYHLNNGCPLPDTDGDGFHDSIDNCPNSPYHTNNGCPVYSDDESPQALLYKAVERYSYNSSGQICGVTVPADYSLLTIRHGESLDYDNKVLTIDRLILPDGMIGRDIIAYRDDEITGFFDDDNRVTRARLRDFEIVSTDVFPGYVQETYSALFDYWEVDYNTDPSGNEKYNWGDPFTVILRYNKDNESNCNTVTGESGSDDSGSGDSGSGESGSGESGSGDSGSGDSGSGDFSSALNAIQSLQTSNNSGMQLIYDSLHELKGVNNTVSNAVQGLSSDLSSVASNTGQTNALLNTQNSKLDQVNNSLSEISDKLTSSVSGSGHEVTDGITFTASLNRIKEGYSSSPLIQSLNAIQTPDFSGSTCPTFDFPYFDQIITYDSHCAVLGEIQSNTMFQALLISIYSLGALFIFLRA